MMEILCISHKEYNIMFSKTNSWKINETKIIISYYIYIFLFNNILRDYLYIHSISLDFCRILMEWGLLNSKFIPSHSFPFFHTKYNIRYIHLGLQ